MCNSRTGSSLCIQHPEVKWAQRIDKVYITIQLSDAKDAKFNLEPDGVFTFSATTAGTCGNLYESKLDLNDKVNVEASKISTGVRSIFCIVEKAEAKWWKKLVRDDQKAPHYLFDATNANHSLQKKRMIYRSSSCT